MPSPPATRIERVLAKEGSRPVEHARIELIGLAVDVHIAARKMGAHQRIAAPDHADDQLVHEGVLGAAQRRQIQPRRRQEGARIDASAVRRIEHDRPAPFGRLEDFEGRVELVFQFGHASWACRTRPIPVESGFDSTMARNASIVHGQVGAGLPRLQYGFTRYLPAAAYGRRRDHERVGGRAPVPVTGREMPKILLAEDDNDMRRFLVKALQNAGYRGDLLTTTACPPISACARSRSSCC